LIHECRGDGCARHHQKAEDGKRITDGAVVEYQDVYQEQLQCCCRRYCGGAIPAYGSQWQENKNEPPGSRSVEDVEGQFNEELHRESRIGMEGRMLEGVDQGPYELGPASEQHRDQRDDSLSPPRRRCGGNGHAGGTGRRGTGESWLRERLRGSGDSGR